MKENGFTLVEIIITILIIGIIGFAVFPLFSHATNTLYSANSKTEAISEARNVLLEDIESKSPEEKNLIFYNTDDNYSINADKYVIDNSYEKPNKKSEDLMIEFYKYK